MPTTTNSSLPCYPHIVACLYEDELASKRAFDILNAKLCPNASVMRFGDQGTGVTVVTVCADDEAAARYSQRLPWGSGTPTLLGADVCATVAARRAEGRRLASSNPTNRLTRRNVAQTLRTPRGAHSEGAQMMALNTDAQPWRTAGGICGAVCESITDADHIREVIVTEHLATFEGMVIAFGDDDSAVTAVVADTPDANAMGAETLLRLAGNLDYQPGDAAWELWAMRLRAGSAPFPITCEGQAARDFLAGKSAARRVKTHHPTRNQPCPCGSGSKYKRCCGR